MDIDSASPAQPADILWTDNDHMKMFLWPETPQFETRLYDAGIKYDKINKIAMHTTDLKVARGIR